MNKDAIKKMRQAIKYGNLSTVKNLLDNDPNLAETDTPFGTWLQVAAAHGQTDIVKYLVEYRMDINKSTGISDGGPIKSAAFKGHLDIVKLLYDNGAVLDVSEAVKNPLFAAIYNGHIDIAKYLIDKGIDLSATYHLGEIENCDALEYAQQYGQMKIYNYIKEKLNK